MRPYLEGEHPIRFAHRGGAGLWPENTMAAFAGSHELGIRYIETDVHVTADGVVVIFHDHALDRLTNGTGRVDEWRWEDIRHLDNAYGFRPGEDFPRRGSGERIPRLDEVLTAYPDVHWNIDMKHTAVVEPLAELVAARGAQDRVMAASFYDHRLRRFRKASQGRVATSAGPSEIARVKAASRLGRKSSVAADALQVPERSGPARLVTPRFIDTAHHSGLAVHVWTVDDGSSMHRLFDLGVDGIMSDRPDVLVEVAASRRK